ncbi:MAG: sugar transferase [Clostridia bacterium]|nr:sugar transferase [Clostridia bacterium]
MYAHFFKRVIDFTLSLMALLILSPILLILILVGAIAMKGNPFFTQQRPGKINKKTGQEKIFRLIKLRTMTNEKDENGNLLPDEKRLNRYGKWLRSTSLDELFELVNIIKGDMAIVGPRPQLVRDMVFMTKEQRVRHSVRPGLTGLAQCNGRNNMSWEKKFEYDLAYIDNKITFFGDIKIIFKTALKVLKSDGINTEGMATAEDLGDYLLHKGEISREEYDAKQLEAKRLLKV